ncbi:L-threonylcarbamoyladenylate synthase [Deinococcus sp. KSM4-11]|uniref:L-threonylcarbamoyladenylate synthase n=1 Tax=Deinococcus sp. KSM4-11 TaxID=2568654 RepID=UPI0010A5741E|nr:L-threonylcarbamoyladenylate synthase [Deinococcus sp. KSM4-11]THF88131.1 L-threonylcarbamoyladenylate synthase [Deinococcus sp. KSM4-11]
MHTDLPSLPGDWPTSITSAVERLMAGQVVAYPSETVWGLAVHPDAAAGVERLWRLKGRDPLKPLQMSSADVECALLLAQEDAELTALAALWPGPLTVVAPASDRCPPAFAPGGRVGLRVPDHPVAQALLRAAGGYLVTTSCNVSGRAPATTFAEATAMGLANQVLPDGGIRSAGLASTVVIVPGGEVLREGSVGTDQISRLLQAARRDQADGL